MKKIYILLAFVTLSAVSFAQTTGSVKGKLIDSLGKQSLKDASVTVVDTKDSSVIVFGLAKADGSFEIRNIPYGSFLLHVSFAGYDPVYKRITVSSTVPVADMGTVFLLVKANDLGNVTVTQSPITMRKDTIVFDASQFKTKPNAVVEDLIKKLPGMDVDKAGNIKSQGETVQRVLVDGKRFFGDSDPKMATKNLPPDVVDKIQVFDDLSDQAKFTGFDDGNRVKTLNITTKKDKRKGYFGKAVLGDGTDGVYDESVNLHRFNGNQQISLLGQANDINKQNFSQQDILGGGGTRGGGGGGAGGMRISVGGAGGGGGGGITTTIGGGLNYRDAWGPNTDAYGSYFYSNLRGVTNQQSLAQNIITPDSSTFSNQTSNSVSRTENHRISFNIESKFDSMNSMVFRPSITFQTSTPYSSATTLTTGGSSGKLINSSVNNASSTNTGYNISGANLQLRHRFAKKFRTASLDLGLSASANNGDGYNYAINKFYQPITKVDTLNQHYTDSANTFSINPTFSYTEPIGANQILEFRYNYSYTQNNSTNNTYEYNNGSHGFTSFDSIFSNSYKFISTSNRMTVSYRVQDPKYNFSIGTGVQYLDFNSKNTTKNITVARNYVSFTPNANFTYNFTRTNTLRVFYNGNTGTPSVAQLQPITTTSDAINFQVGNPNLKPQFSHSFRLLYTNFDVVTQRVIFATINASAIVNDIQSSVIQNPNGGRTTTYVNLDGTYNISGYFNYGFPLKKPKSNLNFTTNVSYSQYQTLVNNVSDFTKTTNLGETIKWTTNIKNNFDMNFGSTTNYTILNNSLQPTLNSNYYTQTFSVEFTAYTNSGWLIASDFDYSYSTNRAAGYNTSVPLLNPSIAKLFGKNQAAEFRLTCFDLLNQNQSATRTTSGNSIVDSKSNVLTRYVMLTFTYNLRQFAGAGQKMPGMFQGQQGNRPGGAQRGGMQMGNMMRGGGFNP